MVSNKTVFIGVCVLILTIVNNAPVEATPQIELMGGYDIIGICITNCAQCKKMYGAFFEGHLCAEACVQFKGKTIPDCEDLSSIAPFLNKMN